MAEGATVRTRRQTYEHLFAQVFAERSLATILVSNGGLAVLSIIYELLGTRSIFLSFYQLVGLIKNGFSFKFFLTILANMMAFSFLVVMRLKIFTSIV